MKRVRDSLPGEFSQGTIFTCGRSEEYIGEDVHGIVITARCDLAHSKVRVYNYLPVLPIQAWLRNEGWKLFRKRASANINDSFKGILRQQNYSPTIMDYEEPIVIYQKLFSSNPDTKHSKKFKRLIAVHNDLQHNAPLHDIKILRKAMVKHPRILSSIMYELIAHKINGFYYIPFASFSSTSMHWIVRMREVVSIPSNLAQNIANGIDENQYAALKLANPLLSGKLDFSKTNFSMPVGILSSPDIEHFLQLFATMFTRIGIVDHKKEEMEKYCNELMEVSS